MLEHAVPRGADHRSGAATVGLAIVGDKERIASYAVTLTIAMSIASVNVNGIRAFDTPMADL